MARILINYLADNRRREPTSVFPALGYRGKAGNHAEAIRHSERACELEPNEVFNYTALSVTFQKAFEGTQDRTFIYKAEEAKTKAHELQHRH